MSTETPTTATSNADPGAATATATPAPVETKAPTGGAAFAGTATVDANKPATDGTAAKEGEAKASTEQKPDAKKDEAKPAAPEKYEDFKLPEGVKITPELLTEIQTLGKELKLPQAEAQKIVEAGVKAAKQWDNQLSAGIKATQAKWAEDLKKDSTLGGEKLVENLGIAQKALNAYDTDGKLNALLQETGLNNNVDVVRYFHKIGLTLKPDQIVQDNSGGSIMNTGGPGSLDAAAKVLYSQKK